MLPTNDGAPPLAEAYILYIEDLYGSQGHVLNIAQYKYLKIQIFNIMPW